MKEEVLNAKKILEDVLARSKRARVNTLYLIAKAYEHEDCRGADVTWSEKGVCTIVIQDWGFETLPSPETWRRVRAKMQNDEGRFLPSDAVLEGRKTAEAEMRDINKWF